MWPSPWVSVSVGSFSQDWFFHFNCSSIAPCSRVGKRDFTQDYQMYWQTQVKRRVTACLHSRRPMSFLGHRTFPAKTRETQIRSSPDSYSPKVNGFLLLLGSCWTSRLISLYMTPRIRCPLSWVSTQFRRTAGCLELCWPQLPHAWVDPKAWFWIQPQLIILMLALPCLGHSLWQIPVVVILE